MKHLILCAQVDVGKCSGMCSGDEGEAGSGRVRDGSATGDNSAAASQDHSPRSCLPFRTRSVAVEGPNGESEMEECLLKSLNTCFSPHP